MVTDATKKLREPVAYILLAFSGLLALASLFQLFVGIHISILISEAALVFSVAVTRQKEGRPSTGFPPSGGVNVPETVAAEVMVVFRSVVSEGFVARSEHVSAAAVVAPRKMMTSAR